MNPPPDSPARQFDDRAQRYQHSSWHEEYARALVFELDLRPGDRVLDCGAGTGMAARPIAERVGDAGQVVAVDVSATMLALLAPPEPANAAPIGRVLADAAALPLPDGAFDAVVGSAVLLYLPVRQALGEWHRVMRPGGVVGFSTMVAGEPPAADLFRELAAGRGVDLPDRSAALGTRAACTRVLSEAGFTGVRVSDAVVHFSEADLQEAWTANERDARQLLRANLSIDEIQQMCAVYERRLRVHRQRMQTGRVLFATARRP